ncbi:MAG: esterase/lipase family protein [Planctomycetota bacterium]
MRSGQFVASILLIALLASGCGGPRYQVRELAEGEWFRAARKSALEGYNLSASTTGILRRRDLLDLARTDPHATVLRLDEEMRRTHARDLSFAIAEIAYRSVLLTNVRDRAVMGTALRYSYAFLFDPKLEPAPDEFDIRFRWACDLYNRTAAKFVRIERGNRNLDPAPFDWATGSATLQPGTVQLNLPIDELETIRVAYDFEVAGLPRPQRFIGLGAPCVLIHGWKDKQSKSEANRFLSDEAAFAATFLVRFPDDASILDDPQPDGFYELYDPTRTTAVSIAGRRVPLEVDYTTPVVYSLSQREVQSPGIKALFRSDEWSKVGGLYSLQPLRPGRIPIVLVHGVASDPLTWMPLYNELMANETIRTRYQFLLWFYPTGQPASYSAYQLRQALQNVRGLLDRSVPDPALDWGVVCGHSMGGLVSRLLVIDPGDALEKAFFTVPIDEMDLPDADKRLLRDVVVFESLPFIRRVIFYATPHRGSPNAYRGVFKWLAGFIQLPAQLLDPTQRVMKYVRVRHTFQRITSLESIRPDNPMLLTIENLPINERVTYHSIIGDEHKAGHKGGSDGYVAYESAHIEGAASEVILKSGHSVQQTPLASRETRRILLKHLAAFDAAQKQKKTGVEE